jgi:hypothetical protein
MEIKWIDPQNKGTTPDERRAIRREWINYYLRAVSYGYCEFSFSNCSWFVRMQEA